MQQPRMWWAGPETGWMIDVETALTAKEVHRAVDYTLKVQMDRYITIPPGDKKMECHLTILALRAGKVTQNIIGTGDKVLFDAYKSTKKIFT